MNDDKKGPVLTTYTSQGENLKWAGTIVFMGGKEWVVPPLSVRQMRDFETDIKSMASMSVQDLNEKLPAIMRVSLAAIKRNYPDMSESDLSDMLDLLTIRQVLEAITLASGFSEVKIKAGEPQPVSA